MENTKELRREIETLRERLSRLTEASLRINQDLDFDAVLQGVLDSACSLSRARYGVLTLLDEGGQAADYLSSGMTAAEAQRLWELPGGLKLFEHLSSIPEPLRLRDLIAHIRSLGLPEPVLPAGAGSPAAFLTAPIHHGEERVGSFFLAGTESDRTFSAEDEEALVIFAGQAALVIANARRFRDERRARDKLETLINTSPIGVVVFDAKAGIASSFNREAKRIAAGLQASGLSPEQVLEVVTYRRADGEEIVLSEFPLAQALSSGETVRLEEIVLQVPDGGRVKVLVNATPIFSDEGEVETFVVTLQDMAPLEEIERLRAEFMEMVIHELRTPLTSIKGSATTLLEESSSLDPTEVRQFLRIISDQSDHMRGLLTDLLDMARIETGTLPVSPQPSETASLVDEARVLFADTGYRHGIQIDVAPDLPQVMADRRRIVDVLSNLLANAAHHSSELSTIRVKSYAGAAPGGRFSRGRGKRHTGRAPAAPVQKGFPLRGRRREAAGRACRVGSASFDLQGYSGGARGPHLGRKRRAWRGCALRLHHSGRRERGAGSRGRAGAWRGKWRGGGRADAHSGSGRQSVRADVYTGRARPDRL